MTHEAFLQSELTQAHAKIESMEMNLASKAIELRKQTILYNDERKSCQHFKDVIEQKDEEYEPALKQNFWLKVIVAALFVSNVVALVALFV